MSVVGRRCLIIDAEVSLEEVCMMERDSSMSRSSKRPL